MIGGGKLEVLSCYVKLLALGFKHFRLFSCAGVTFLCAHIVKLDCFGYVTGNNFTEAEYIAHSFVCVGHSELCCGTVTFECAVYASWQQIARYIGSAREVVTRMNELGMLIDVSPISDEAFYDVLECSSKPVVATHSCCRTLADHPRNMTDDMIRALASRGGVIQINFYPVFLDDSIKESDMYTAALPSYRRIADHIDHVVSLVGVDHVGIGSDFDGIDVAPQGLEDISMMPVLFDELRTRGYTERDLEKIASENFFNAFSC